MKKLVSVIILASLCSACTTGSKANLEHQKIAQATIPNVDYRNTSGETWGNENEWSLTPDGYPIW